mmetsp:Transcript_86557/g.217982  ORF Transcript_86557/g.217982 Transcript_86557/m.217982 type:complete len:149 (-) Transcript_86557:19-465(-)
MAHLFFANGIFMGGILFALGAGLFSCQQGKPFRLQLALAAAGTVAFVLMGCFGNRGFKQVGEHGRKESMVLMKDDYLSYCKGVEGTMHGNVYINMSAASEWVLLASIACLIFTTLRADLRDFPAATGRSAALCAAAPATEAGTSLQPP